MGFYALDGQGRFIYLNQALTDIFGYQRKELLGKPALETIVHPSERTRVRSACEMVLRGDSPFLRIRFLGSRSDGKEVHCEALIWTAEGPEGAICVGSILDISDRIRAERKLALIRELGQRAVLLLDVEEVGRAVVRAVAEVVGVRTCGLWLVEGEELVRVAHSRGGDRVRLSLHGEEGIIAACVREGQPIYVPDTAKDPRYIPGIYRTRSEFCVPLIARGRVVGALNAEMDEPEAFSAEERELLETLAALAAIAVENALRFTRERKLQEQLRLINEVALRAAVIRDPRKLFRTVVELIAEKFGYHSVALFVAEGGEAALAAIAGELASLVPKGYRQPLSVGIIGHVIRSGESHVAPDVERDPHYIRGYEGDVLTRSELCVPIKREETVIGALDVQSRDRDAFGEADIVAMEAVARWIGVALENAELYQELQRALEGAAITLARVVELRDPYTAGHQRRVAALAEAIAKEMGLPSEAIRALRLAALLHDIGKIAVPAEVLNKPGRLDRLEMKLVRRHPWVAYQILKDMPFPYPVAEIVLQHHERLDGSGYPRGLKGEDILPEARILAVADVVEAMISHRPYRPARGLGKALAEIQRGKGTLYDPAAVEACVRLFREEGFKFPAPRP